MAPRQKQRLPRGILPDGIDVPEGTDIMQFCRDLAESGAQFAEQFDRDNVNFHNGITQAVPLGGANLPESMKGEIIERTGISTDGYAAWRDLPVAAIALEDDHGAEYHKWMEMHTRLNTCKKALAVVNKPVEVALKLRLQYKDALSNLEGDNGTVLQGRLKGAENDRNGALDAATATIFDMDPEIVTERCRSVILDVVAKGKFEFIDRESYGEYIQLLKRANQEIFLVQKDLLQRIKDAKKANKERHMVKVIEAPKGAEAAKVPEASEAAEGGA